VCHTERKGKERREGEEKRRRGGGEERRKRRRKMRRGEARNISTRVRTADLLNLFSFFILRIGDSPPVPPRLQDLVEATHMPQKNSTAHSVPGGIPGVGFFGAYVWPQPNAHNPGEVVVGLFFGVVFVGLWLWVCGCGFFCGFIFGGSILSICVCGFVVFFVRNFYHQQRAAPIQKEEKGRRRRRGGGKEEKRGEKGRRGGAGVVFVGLWLWVCGCGFVVVGLWLWVCVFFFFRCQSFI
jgi:hypothetical protein